MTRIVLIGLALALAVGRAEAEGLGFQLPAMRAAVSATIADPGGMAPAPLALSIPKGCPGCRFALVHVARTRVSSDDDTLTFADPARRLAHPVVLHLGTSDNHGDGTTPGAFWSPLHDVWAIAPVADDGTVAATWKSGAWFASYCAGQPCWAMKAAPSIAVEVVAGLVADGAGVARAHFASERRVAYQAFNDTTVDATIDLAGALPGVAADAPLYLGAVEVGRVSGDNTLVTVDGQGIQLPCSDAHAFAADGAGPAYSPLHGHTVAWAGGGPSLTVHSQTGGFVAVKPSGATPHLAVSIDGWVGGATPGGALFHPGDGQAVKVPLDAGGDGALALPDALLPGGRLPEVVVAVVTVSGVSSDVVSVTVGGQTTEFGTSNAKMGGAQPGSAKDPAHSDLFFARPTPAAPPAADAGAADGGLAAGTPMVAVHLATGGWVDRSDPAVTVQWIGAFAAPVEPPSAGNPNDVTGGCGCALGARAPSPWRALSSIALLPLALHAISLRRGRHTKAGRAVGTRR